MAQAVLIGVLYWPEFFIILVLLIGALFRTNFFKNVKIFTKKLKKAFVSSKNQQEKIKMNSTILANATLRPHWHRSEI